MLPELDGNKPQNVAPPRVLVNGSSPPVLTRAPTGLLLLKALGRRWLLASLLGLFVATLAGGGTFYFLPPPKHTVRTLIHVPPQRGVVFKQAASGTELSNHQRTQAAMLKSRLVLNSALHDAKVAKLSVVKEQIEPVEWLEKEIRADFSIAPEVMRITMSDDKADQLAVLVDAIVQAYRREIVDNERTQRRDRLTMLRQLRDRYEGELRERLKAQRKIEQDAGGRDATVRALVLRFEQNSLATHENLLLQKQVQLQEARLDLKLQQLREQKPTEITIPNSVVDQEVDRTAAVAKLLFDAQQLQERIDKDREAWVNADTAPQYKELVSRQKRLQKTLAEQREKLRPRISQQLRERYLSQVTDNSGVLKAKITGLVEEIDKFLTPEVERLRNLVQDMAKNSGQLDAFQDDIVHLKNLTDRIINEEQALNVELDAPSEFKVLEEAQILHANSTVRMISMVGGAAVAGLAVVLLAIAWWEFRRRRIDAVEVVSHDLGLRVVGALPDTARRVPRRLLGGGSHDAYLDLLLTESIDATRTMMLHLARAESVQVVMVTSATAGEGKTSLSSHLAASMARIGLKTLLIDGDLRNPTAHRLFEVANDRGLSELLLGEAEVAAVIRPTAVSGLSLLPAGVWDSEVSQMLAQNQARAVFEKLRKEYDFILVDSSPVLPVADALMIGQVVDAVIFSILCDVSRLPNVYTATQRMAALGIRNLGAVVNGVQGELYVSSYPYASRARGKQELASPQPQQG